MRGAFKKKKYKCSLTVRMKIEFVSGDGRGDSERGRERGRESVCACVCGCVCVCQSVKVLICDHQCLFNVSAQPLGLQGTFHALSLCSSEHRIYFPRILNVNS